tara:strand:+ start:7434 stop:7877 length:444 start_codon:yes stop_codon:yes gene_type:complete
MSTPEPREAFKTDEEYYRAFWIMSELGVDINDHVFFKDFFSSGLCPQTEEEESHWFDLPERVTAYRGFCKLRGYSDGMSWTPNKELAQWFASRLPRNEQPTLATTEVPRDKIMLVFLDREPEYIILSVGQDVTETPLIKTTKKGDLK